MPPFMPPRDPRTNPAVNDRILLKSEGSERIITSVSSEVVIWRYAGGTVKRTSSLALWRNETSMASVIFRG
jgi:hypothetical protein